MCCDARRTGREARGDILIEKILRGLAGSFNACGIRMLILNIESRRLLLFPHYPEELSETIFLALTIRTICWLRLDNNLLRNCPTGRTTVREIGVLHARQGRAHFLNIVYSTFVLMICIIFSMYYSIQYMKIELKKRITHSRTEEVSKKCVIATLTRI